MTRAIASEPDSKNDAELLTRFAAARDEPAFATLVDRHGPMVLGICRRILRNSADAEDAFQATFLLLAMRAGRLREPGLLGNWLFGVATRTALGARRATARRIVQEKRLMRFLGSRRPATTDDADLQMTLDEQIAKLPDKLRRVIVCCHLQGLTKRETARQLHWPESTVTARLKQAREMLRERLAVAGILASDSAIGAALGPATVHAALGAATVKAAKLAAVGKLTSAAGVSSNAITMAKAAAKVIVASQVKLAAGVIITLGVAVVGTDAFLQPGTNVATQTSTTPGRSAPAASQPPALKPESVLVGAKALNSIRQAIYSIQIYASRHGMRLPPDLNAAHISGPIQYLANGGVRTMNLKNSFAIVIIAEVPPAGYDGPIGLGYLDGHAILVSQAEAQERIDECRSFFETARNASPAKPADGATLVSNAALPPAVLPESRAALPTDVRDAIAGNAAALSPLTIAWKRTGASPLGEGDAIEKLYVDAFFFQSGSHRIAWSLGKFYEWNSYVRGEPYETAFDAQMIVNVGSGPRPYISKRQVSALRDGDRFDCEFLERIGLHLPGNRREIKNAQTTSSLLTQLELGASVMAIADVTMDGRVSKRVSLVAANPDHRWLRRLPAVRDYVYYLDPQMRYAVWRMEERYGDRLLSRTDNDRFEQLDGRSVWLPQRSVKSFYSVRMLPEHFFENPVLTETLELTEISGSPVPDDRFALKLPPWTAKVVSAKGVAPTTGVARPELPLPAEDVLAGVAPATKTGSPWWGVTATISGIVVLLATLVLWKHQSLKARRGSMDDSGCR